MMRALGVSKLLSHGITDSQRPKGKGYVLGHEEGEHLIHFRDHGSIFIKLGSATGSETLAASLPNTGSKIVETALTTYVEPNLLVG